MKADNSNADVYTGRERTGVMTQSSWACRVCGTQTSVVADDMTPKAIENPGAFLCRKCSHSVMSALSAAARADFLRSREAKTALSAISRLANATVYETNKEQREAYHAASDPFLPECIYCTICDEPYAAPGMPPAAEIAVCESCTIVLNKIGEAFGEFDISLWRFRSLEYAREAIADVEDLLRGDGEGS